MKIPYKSYYSDSFMRLKKFNVYEDQIIDLPILKDTLIPKLVPAKDVFLNIYSYISSKKDVKIEDDRSDIMKLVSAGFDKIVSFRNIIFQHLSGCVFLSISQVKVGCV